MIETKRIKGTAQISHLYWLYLWCAHSHLLPLTTKSVILLYSMRANWTNFFDCVPNTKWTLILPFASFTKPVYISWRCIPSSAHLLFSGLLSEDRSSLSFHQPSLVFFLKRTFSPSLRIAFCSFLFDAFLVRQDQMRLKAQKTPCCVPCIKCTFSYTRKRLTWHIFFINIYLWNFESRQKTL